MRLSTYVLLTAGFCALVYCVYWWRRRRRDPPDDREDWVDAFFHLRIPVRGRRSSRDGNEDGAHSSASHDADGGGHDVEFD
jgi:hypothetical protein